MKKFLLILLTITLILFVFTGCEAFLASMMDEFTNPEEVSASNALIQMIFENGTDDIGSHLHPDNNEAEFMLSITQIKSQINGDYVSSEPVYKGINKTTTNSVLTEEYAATYLITTTTKEYYVHTTWLVNSSGKGISTITVEEALSDDNIFNMILKGFSILAIIFTIVTLIVCIKTKMRMKGLFIALIVVLNTGLTITIVNGFHFNFDFIFKFVSSYLSNSQGFSLSIGLPIGSLLFWINRNRFKGDDPKKSIMNLIADIEQTKKEERLNAEREALEKNNQDNHNELNQLDSSNDRDELEIIPVDEYLDNE